MFPTGTMAPQSMNSQVQVRDVTIIQHIIHEYCRAEREITDVSLYSNITGGKMHHLGVSMFLKKDGLCKKSIIHEADFLE